jgi:peroxiredoxin Q/BCP
MNAAPNFSLLDQDGKAQALADYHGQWLVLYFYPKDDTPGCTTEACSFRDEYDYIKEQGAMVLGISKDSVKSHKKFAAKYNLHFPLLSDEDHTVIEAYGSWQPKKFMGKEFLGTNRDTFLINPEGQIAKEYRGVTPKGHAVQIIKDLEALKA